MPTWEKKRSPKIKEKCERHKNSSNQWRGERNVQRTQFCFSRAALLSVADSLIPCTKRDTDEKKKTTANRSHQHNVSTFGMEKSVIGMKIYPTTKSRRQRDDKKSYLQVAMLLHSLASRCVTFAAQTHFPFYLFVCFIVRFAPAHFFSAAANMNFRFVYNFRKNFVSFSRSQNFPSVQFFNLSLSHILSMVKQQPVFPLLTYFIMMCRLLFFRHIVKFCESFCDAKRTNLSDESAFSQFNLFV